MTRLLLRMLLIGAVVLLAVVVINTGRFKPQPSLVRAGAGVALPAGALRHLQQAVQLRTVSLDTATAPDSAQFLGFQRFLRQAYPRVHRQLRREVVNRYSVLYTWPGTQPTLAPVVLLAHLDVVPVEAETLGQWRYPPFGGELHEGQVWGRGTIDNKGNLIALLEAAEQLLSGGFRPARTVYFAFGHDEEIGGPHGARQIARLLQRRRVRPAFVLDEGGFVTTGKLPGLVGTPVALVATAEKGYLSLQISANLAGGHSSMPETETALGLVAQAVATLQRHAFPAQLTPAMRDFAAHVGPHMPYGQRLAFANSWLFEPVILGVYSKSAAGAAMVHTTLVPTLFRSGVKDNVVPTAATATVNLRLLPGTSAAAALAQVRAWLPDPRLTIRPVGLVVEAPPRASTAALGYQLIDEQIRQLVPGVVPTPFQSVGLTDSRYFLPLTPNIYRFSPYTDPAGLHIVNERISVASYRQAIGFYQGLLQKLSPAARSAS